MGSLSKAVWLNEVPFIIQGLQTHFWINSGPTCQVALGFESSR